MEEWMAYRGATAGAGTAGAGGAGAAGTGMATGTVACFFFVFTAAEDAAEEVTLLATDPAFEALLYKNQMT